jgi:Spy/CpxP family protein refolding chaperone
MIRTTRGAAGFLFAMALAAGLHAEAPPAGTGRNPGARIDRYREQLSLTPEQVGKIRAVLEEAERDETALREKTEARVRDMLTETQRNQFDEIRQSPQRPGSRRRSAGRWLGPSLDDLQRELDLTPEQHETIAGIVQTAADAIRRRFEEAPRNGRRSSAASSGAATRPPTARTAPWRFSASRRPRRRTP